jgi:isopenicillin N synthase-like dioxygenase
MLAYYDAALDLGVRLSRAIALDLGLPEDHFDCAFTIRWRRCACCTTRPRPGRKARSGRARIPTTGSSRFS